MGLYVLIRPGPYCYSELDYAGLPGWLCRGYPQVLARRLDGKPHSDFSISYVHPLYLQKVQRWYERVCPIIARHLVSRGGCVPFVQIDNELTGIHMWFGGPDCNPESMGFGQPEGRYPSFLRRRFGQIGELNAAYGTSFADFAEVRPIEPQRWDLAESRRVKDYFDFYLQTVAEYGATLAGWMRRHGIDVPIVHNAANPNMNCLLEPMAAALKPAFLLGSDHYYNLDGQNNPTPEYAVKVFYSCAILESRGFAPTVFELPGGAVFDWPPVSPEDHAACYWTNLAMGMKGHNYYIFTGGPNPGKAGLSADVYDYNASVGADNEVRPLYAVQQELGRFVAAYPWLLEARREGDIRVGYDALHNQAMHYWKQHGELPFSPADGWDFFRKGLLVSAFCGGLSPVLCDLSSDDWLADISTPVAVIAASAMSADKQRRLTEFLRRGGRLLLGPVLPSLDENLQPCTILAGFLGRPRSVKSPGGPVRPMVDGLGLTVFGAGTFFLDNLPAGAEIIGRDAVSNQPVAAAIRTEGGGSTAGPSTSLGALSLPKGSPQGGEALLLGLHWTHHRNEHHRLLKLLAKRLGWRPLVACSNPCVWTSLRTAGGRSMLFLMNLLSSPQEAEVSCRPAWSKHAIHLGRHRLAPMSVTCVEAGGKG